MFLFCLEEGKEENKNRGRIRWVVETMCCTVGVIFANIIQKHKMLASVEFLMETRNRADGVNAHSGQNRGHRHR